MTFDAFETAQETGAPIEIYRFDLGADTFEYTSAEDDQVVSTITYSAIPIQRGPISHRSGESQEPLTITVPGDNEFAIKYISNVPGVQAFVTIQRFHRTDTPTPQVITVFEGFVQSVAFVEQAKEARIAVAPTESARSRPIPRFTYQGLCNHILYDSGCKVNKDDVAFKLSSGSVTVISGNDITVPGAAAFGDGWFTGGYVELLSGTDFRLVLNHVGDVLTLLLPFPTDAESTVNVYAGCDHSIATCNSKFFTSEDVTSNVINFGGYAFVPTRNPFESGLN